MKWHVRVDPQTHEEYLSVDGRGRPVLLNPFTNKGTAFTPEERDVLHLHGLLPPASCSIEQQLVRTYENFQAKPSSLERFIYLAALQDRNETLFFRLLYEYIDEMMPVVYTPVVGEACQKFSHIYRRGRGLYIPYAQRDKMEQILSNVPREPAVIVVTDGERILGLGDQGAGGMGIPIGKLCLYTLCAGVPPYLTLPIMLDVGTDNEERLADPLYLGERHRRVRGEEYQAFVDRFVEAVKKVHPHALLQWEDFLKENAIKQLHRFRDRLCSFNDDIQGTAGVVVAGVFSGLRITGQAIEDQRILFAGAGASAQGISDLLVSAMRETGLSLDGARKRIWTVDSKGLVTTGRPGLEGFKATYARDPAEVAGYDCRDRARITLGEAVLGARPTILIGTSGTPGMFSEPVVRAMAGFNERPMIFPLSNPTSKSECTAEEAVRWSEGRAIVATGSPFDPVDYGGRRHRIGQGNNAFIFPGVGLGVWLASARRVSDGMFLDAAKALAGKVTDADLAETAVYPELTRIRDCSHAVACAVVRRAVAEGHAEERVLEDLEERLEKAMWFPEYRPVRFEPRTKNDGRAEEV
jgi:malic enzyme